MRIAFKVTHGKVRKMTSVIISCHVNVKEIMEKLEIAL